MAHELRSNREGSSRSLEQSELFKIFIDAFGAGVFAAKHSTIFEKLISSRGLLGPL